MRFAGRSTVHNSIVKTARSTLVVIVALSALSAVQSVTSRKKQILVMGEKKGYRHEAVSHAMATIERLGNETGLWDATLRTDTEPLTKKKARIQR